MAGFEVIVRPVVFPDIRPRPRQSLPPQDDPEKGFAVIKGNPARAISLSDSWSASSSQTRPKETQRRVDQARVYQVDDNGTVNKDNFIDIEVANRIHMKEGGGEVRPHYYERVKEADNIEIRERDKIITASDADVI